MPAVWTQTPARSVEAGIDPAIDWAIDRSKDEPAPGGRYYFVAGVRNRWVPVVLLLNNSTVRDFWRGDPFITNPKERKTWQKNLRIPQFFLNPPKGLERLKFFSATVPTTFFDELIDRKLIPKYVTRVELSLPLRASSLRRI